MANINGACRCGRVTYTCSAEPIFTGICHCKSCQKSSGSAFGTVVAVPDASITVNGVTTRFDDVGDSGQATHRNFCPTCGTTVTRSADLMPNVTMVEVGTLDDASVVQPVMQIYCDSALPWAMIPQLQGFAKMPNPPDH